jgi:hypothetical protein
LRRAVSVFAIHFCGSEKSEMEKEKKPEFVVTDRRKFTVDGEPRPDAPPDAPEDSRPAAPATTASHSVAPPAEPVAPPATSSIASTPPQAAPEVTKTSSTVPDLKTGYDGDAERTAFGGQKMEFVHLLDLLVQSAMMYAGAMETGTERRVDVVGLRQMIDLIAILEEKTKGNLTEQEQAILTNTVFQLRMTYMEIVNMIDRQAMQKAPGAPGAKRK